MRVLIKAGTLMLFALLADTGSLYTQLSPGDLIQGHAGLEGIENCTKCHDVGQKLNGSKCLACHVELKLQIDRGKGFHVSEKVKGKECINCHFDHKGRGFKMILWDGGQKAFEHDLTGYHLEDKHRITDCEKCHNAEQIVEATVKQQAGKTVSLKTTFLGLSQRCSTCHFDEHRGQLSDRCENCHDFKDWKTSAGVRFNHDSTAYPLTGLHRSVECKLCHQTIPDGRKLKTGGIDADFVRYKPLSFQNCTPCHNDVHENRFGQNCTKCHVTDGWKWITDRNFDHRLTKYPLTGKHATVSCEACHQPDRKKLPVYRGLKFGRCSDCHLDEHVGQLTARPDSGACESCHGVEGFTPSAFSVERHNEESKYLLLGRHAKTLCGQCHPKSAPAAFEFKTGLKAPKDSTVVLHFTDRRCTACHEDIHRGQFEQKVKENDCSVCHTFDGWKQLVFDHNRDARLALTGKHQSVECAKCHPVVDAGTPRQRVLYRPLKAYCGACHKDPHEGQFLTMRSANETFSEARSPCEQCHTAGAWKPVIFDHVRSRFLLEGAHAKVMCEKCHPKTYIRSDSLNTLYKPIDTACASCHPDVHEGVFEK